MPSGVIGVSPIPRNKFPSKIYIHIYDDGSFSQPADESLHLYNKIFEWEMGKNHSKCSTCNDNRLEIKVLRTLPYRR